MLNSSVDIKAPLCGLSNNGGQQIPCEWPLQWTLIAAFGSVTVFCIIQVALYYIDDPGSKKQKITSQDSTRGYEPEIHGNEIESLPAIEPSPKPTGTLPQVTEESELEENFATQPVIVDGESRKLALGPVPYGLQHQHGLLPVEEEANEVPESDEAVQPIVDQPSTPSKTVIHLPPQISEPPANSDRRRTLSECKAPLEESHKVSPSNDKLLSHRQSAATVTIAMLNAPENRQEANNLRRNTATITGTTSARHFKELQQHRNTRSRKASETDIFLNSLFNRRHSGGSSDRRIHHHASGSHILVSASSQNTHHLGVTSSHTAESDLHMQGVELGKTIAADDSSSSATSPPAPRPSFISQHSVPSTHKDDLSVPSRASTADNQQGIGRRYSSGASRFAFASRLKRAVSHEPPTKSHASEAIEMNVVSPSKQ